MESSGLEETAGERRYDAETLRQAGARFYEEAVPADFTDNVGPDEVLCRFVTSFATTVEEVDRFGELIA